MGRYTGKTKDGLSARFDLMALGIRKKFTPIVGNKKIYLPLACYILTREEKKNLCETLCQQKVPDGYSYNFRHLLSMQDLIITNLKSHDCHTLMQQLLPAAIRGILPKHVRFAIS